MSDMRASAAAPNNQNTDPVKVMVVDDALVIRGMLTRMLEESGDIAVVASAGDGERALTALRRTPVDVIVLDIEMPRMDGIEALPKLIEIQPGVQVVMASTLTKRNAEISMKALELGAADYLTKPGSSGELRSADAFKRDLTEKVRTLGKVARQKSGRSRTAPAAQPRTTSGFRASGQTTASSTGLGRGKDIPLVPQTAFRPDALAIGSSTGGPQALLRVLTDLGKVDQPVFITQHMPPTFTTILAEHIARATGRSCVEGADGMVVEPGKIYLAPGDRHMLIKRSGVKVTITLSDGPAENFCRPAVDPMLRSLSTVYGSKMLITILTGMGADGAKGAKLCKEAGAQVIAQDEASSVVWGMPGATAMAGICGAVLPLDRIGAEIRRFAVNGGRP